MLLSLVSPRDLRNSRWNSSRRRFIVDSWTLNESSTESNDRVSSSRYGGDTWWDASALWSGGILKPLAPTHSSISLWVGFCAIGLVRGILGGCEVKTGRDEGGAANCRSYGISGAIVCIISAKVCTCFARLMNASGETIKGPIVSPGGRV